MAWLPRDRERKIRKVLNLLHLIYMLKIICGTKLFGNYGMALKKILRYVSSFGYSKQQIQNYVPESQ